MIDRLSHTIQRVMSGEPLPFDPQPTSRQGDCLRREAERLCRKCGRPVARGGRRLRCEACLSEYYHGYKLKRAEHIREYQEQYRKTHIPWSKTHPIEAREVKAVALANREAARAGVLGKLTTAEWRELKHAYGNRCLRCGRAELVIDLTLDHVIPYSKGGTNWISNVQPLCFSCNSSKGQNITDYRNV